MLLKQFRLSPRLLFVIGLALYGFVFFKNAWVSDDAYILFRSLDQLLSGHGPRWNPHERVHLHGRKALEAIANNDFNGALLEAKQMEEASHEVIEMLQELHHAYSEHHKELFEGTSN